ncbi:disintegrin and metalloproteinase domain-containing protein 21-like [Python bivittatus]|uniref:Disintegrin and metalloproteinase domain-containing protein 21-like n=1 Tax=Python bivittatus TaxID=176946 RepID=A0A9F5N2P8_PYTBI|nr:disintegrin and metalloproteinase domain-containing protein 21-like [Python bivittatus]
MARGGRDLGCWFFLPLATCIMLVVFTLSTIHCSSLLPLAYTSYEVMIPRRLAARGGKTKKDEISYIIKAAGRDYIVRLKPKKNFLAKNLPIFTYNSKGERVESHPYIPVECYYQGYVEGIVDSLAVLRTCFGLTGFLKIGARTYGIEPLRNSSAFQHLLYISEESEPIFPSYRMGVGRTTHQAEKLETRQLRSMYSDLQYEGVPKYIELYVVVDKNMFALEANNVTIVETTVLDVVNIVDATFYSLNTNIVLVGIEIWTEKNLISMSADITQVLQNFNNWRIVSKIHRPAYDTAFLFLHQTFGDIFGKSHKSSICKPGFSAGLQVYIKNEMIRFAKGFSHELAYHIGMEHDGPYCFCGKYINCIMYTYHAAVNLFSNCSILNFRDLSEAGHLNCLLNVPRIQPSNLDHCGNGILNNGEQCDCGGAEKCKRDPCCDPNCVFKAKAVCAVGKCCRRCRYLFKGEICRGKASECDLPEYCNGKSAECPKDLYMQDGTSCGKYASYCYKNKCQSHALLCSSIFGGQATAAPESCYLFLNTLGTQFGNCGSDSIRKKYLKCQPEDSMCGRVQCVGVGSAPVLKDMEVHKHKVREVMCWSTEHRGETHHTDIGAVPNGILCAPHKVCINRRCVPTTVFNSSCSPRNTCRARGVCNNLHKCHCNIGWAPPHCKYWGAGGSIDGGFPVVTQSTALAKRILGTVIPFSLVIIAAITAIGPKVVEFLASLKMWWRQNFRPGTFFLKCLARESTEHHKKDELPDKGNPAR